MKITKDQLNHRHKDYDRNVKLWNLYMAAYKGIDSIIKGNYIKQHEREPDTAYTRRMDALYSFAYSKSVVEIYIYHLMSKPPQGRTIKDIEDDAIFDMFWNDTDLFQNGFDSVMATLSLYASIQGHMGILVDKPPVQAKSRKEQIDKRLHPYTAVYHPGAILDWKFQKNKETHRPELVFLKLREDDETIRIITPEAWGVFPDEGGGSSVTCSDPYPAIKTQGGTGSGKNVGAKAAPNSVPKDVRGRTATKSKDNYVQATDEGINALGEIPFIWYYSEESDEQGIGISDLNEISRIDISIINNASQIEEIITYAAFPMLMKPKRDASTRDGGSQQEDEVGVQSVIEFDPEYPESRPGWLTPEVESAINAVLKFIEHKVAEIYRAANIGGLAGTEISTQAKSGVALKTEFQVLNSKMVRKANNLEKTENKIMEFFLKWEGKWDQMKDKVKMGRAKSFNVEDIAADLQNALTAQTVVLSDTFSALLQKQVSRQILPSVSEDEQATIDQEIDDSVELKAKEVDDIDNADQDIIDDGTNTEFVDDEV